MDNQSIKPVEEELTRKEKEYRETHPEEFYTKKEYVYEYRLEKNIVKERLLHYYPQSVYFYSESEDMGTSEFYRLYDEDNNYITLLNPKRINKRSANLSPMYYRKPRREEATYAFRQQLYRLIDLREKKLNRLKRQSEEIRFETPLSASKMLYNEEKVIRLKNR